MQSRGFCKTCIILHFIMHLAITECTSNIVSSNMLYFSRKGKKLSSESEKDSFTENSYDLAEKVFLKIDGGNKYYVYESIWNLFKLESKSNFKNELQKSINQEIVSNNLNESILDKVNNLESNSIFLKTHKIEANLIKRRQIGKRSSIDELDLQRTINPSANCTTFIFQDRIIFGNNTTDYDNVFSRHNSSNHQAPKFRLHTVVKGLVLFGLGFVALIGNVATFVSIKRLGRHQSSTVYLLLIHLTAADLLVTWFCIVGEAIWTFSVEWIGSDSMCKLYKFLQMFALYLSTFTIIVIGFDRLFAVRYPMRRVNARNLVQKSILLSWIFSCLLSLPQVVIFRVVKGPFEEEFFQCVTYGFYTAAWQEQLYTSLSLLFMFIIPLILLIGTYTATFLTIASKKKVFGDAPNLFEDARYKILRRAKVKSLWITVVIVTTFMICWTPYYISMIITVFLEPDEQLGEDLNDAIFFFGSSTAVLNPIIYGAFHLKRKGRRTSSSGSSRYELTLVFSTLRRMRDSLARRSGSRQSSRKRQSPVDDVT